MWHSCESYCYNEFKKRVIKMKNASVSEEWNLAKAWIWQLWIHCSPTRELLFMWEVGKRLQQIRNRERREKWSQKPESEQRDRGKQPKKGSRNCEVEQNKWRSRTIREQRWMNKKQ